MSEIKLLPCPFCGGGARMMGFDMYGEEVCVNYHDEIKYTQNHYITCNGCDTDIWLGLNAKDTIEKWNTRKPMERILTRLEEARAECKELQRSTTDAYGYMKMKQGIDCVIDIVKEEGGIE